VIDKGLNCDEPPEMDFDFELDHEEEASDDKDFEKKIDEMQ
jgi:hypothetical protein